MTTGVNCTVMVNGVRAPDGSTGDDINGPVVLDNLTVTWGRSDTMGQPDVDSCSFDVMDNSGNGFTNTFRTGARVDVLARGAAQGTESNATFSNPGFETAAVVWSASNASTALTAQRVRQGAQSLHVRPTDPTAASVVLLAPAPFETAGTNPDAWDAIPTTEIGQTWATTVSVWVPTGAVAEVRPALFTGPYVESATAAGTSVMVTGNDTWQTVDASHVVTTQGPRWLGLVIRLNPTGRAWDQMPPALTWDGVDGSLTWDDMGTMFIDDAQVTSPATASGRSVLVFVGRITELTSAWDDAAGAPVVSVTASGFTADLQNRTVGDEPWNVESVDARARRILTLAGLPITLDIDASLAATLLSWRDVDAQGALTLLQQIAVSVDGVLWPAVHASLGAYLHLENPSARPSLLSFYEQVTLPVVLATNLATNPDAEAFGAAATVRTNLHVNPTVGATGTTNWVGNFGLGGAGTVTHETTGGHTGPDFIRMTWTTGNTDIGRGMQSATPLTPNVPVGPATAALWVRVNRSQRMGIAIAGAVIANPATVVAPQVVVPANTWTRLTWSATLTGAGAMEVRAYAQAGTGGHTWAPGDTLDVDDVLVEAAPVVLPYFDGTTAAGGDFTYGWTGTAHASTSTQRAPAVAGVSAYNGTLGVRWSSVTEHYSGARAFACMPVVSNQVGFIWFVTPALAGQWITARARVKAPIGYSMTLGIRTSGGGAVGGIIITGTGDWQDVACSAQAATDGSIIGAQLVNRTPYQVGVPFYVDQTVIVTSAAPYTGAYFDGNTPDTASRDYAWTGTANASASTESTWLTTKIIIVETDPATGFNISACDVLRDPVNWVQSVSDVATRVNVQWKQQGVDDEGNNKTTDLTVRVVDTALETIHGTRAVSASTQLQSATDATAVAEQILARTSSDAWRATGFTIDDDDLSGGNDTALMLDLLDGTSRIGAPIIVEELPTWAPAGTSTGVYLEGGTYRFVGGRWVLELTVSSSVGLGGSAQWDELDPDWQWDQMDPAITWDDIRGVSV